MRRNVKLVALFIALVMALSVLAGCAMANPTAVPGITGPLMKEYPEFTTAHTLKVTYFEQGWTGPESDLDVIAPEIAKRTNLTLVYEPMTVPTGDDYTQKLNLMVASGEIPDVFMGGNDAYTRTIYEKLGQAGKIKDLTETLKSYERIYSLVFPESNLYKTAAGKNYFIPTQTGRGNEVLNEPPHGLYVRKDFLDQLKMEYPTTPDELKTYLKRSLAEIKVNGESVLPLVLGENLSGIEQLYEPFFPLIGLQESYSLPFDPKDNFKVKNYEYTNSPELMQAAKYIHSLMAEGLIDSEVLTIKTAQQQEKVSSGLVSAVTTAWWDMNTYSDNAKAAVPDLMFVAAPQIFASKAIQNSRIVDWTNPISCWSSLIISSKVDDVTMKHFLAVLDYLTTSTGTRRPPMASSIIRSSSSMSPPSGSSRRSLPPCCVKTISPAGTIARTTATTMSPPWSRPRTTTSSPDRSRPRSSARSSMRSSSSGPASSPRSPKAKSRRWSISGRPPPRAWASKRSSPSARPTSMASN
jgi:putative aldouronate transport system substrate-binding protein